MSLTFPVLLKSGWNRSLQEARVWFGLLQPSPIVAAPALAVEVAASARGFEIFDLLVAAVDPSGDVSTHAVGLSRESLPPVHDASYHLT